MLSGGHSYNPPVAGLERKIKKRGRGWNLTHAKWIPGARTDDNFLFVCYFSNKAFLLKENSFNI